MGDDMRKFCIKAKQAGSLNSMIGKELPLLPAIAVRDAMKRRDIRINGERVQSNLPLKPGDEVELFTAYPMNSIPVLFENGDCVVVNKPAGLNTDENESSSYSLIAWARERSGTGEAPALVHRLDNQTSGLVIIAKHTQAEQALLLAIQHRQMTKQYICLVKGSPVPQSAVRTAWLLKDAAAARVSISEKELAGSKKIITEYAVMDSGPVSRLKVTLHTGRTHQIRAHLAFLKHPVLGDEVYGDRGFNRAYHARSLKLCAFRLSFPMDCPVRSLCGLSFEINPPF